MAQDALYTHHIPFIPPGDVVCMHHIPCIPPGDAACTHCAVQPVWVRTGGAGFWGVTQLTFGIVGSLVSLISMVVVSLITAEPDKATQKMVDDVRVPSGKTILGKSH